MLRNYNYMNNRPIINREHTTISSAAYAIARSMDEYACSYEDLFINNLGVGVPVVSRKVRYSASKMATIWNLAADRCEDSFFGVKTAKNFCHTSFYALDFSLYASSNVLEVLQKFDRYKFVISEAIATRLDVDD